MIGKPVNCFSSNFVIAAVYDVNKQLSHRPHRQSETSAGTHKGVYFFDPKTYTGKRAIYKGIE